MDALSVVMPEGPLVRDRGVSTALVDGIVSITRSTSALTRMLFETVRNLAANPNSSISKPAQITLSLVIFAQSTPLVLALRFAASIPTIRLMPAIAHEVRRLAAGIAAIGQGGAQLEYARLVDAPGSTLLAGKCLPTLAAIGQYVATQQEGDRWSQVNLPRLPSHQVLEMGKMLYLQWVRLPQEVGGETFDEDDEIEIE